MAKMPPCGKIKKVKYLKFGEEKHFFFGRMKYNIKIKYKYHY